MSKRAEEAALKAYPQPDDSFYKVIRDCYVEGYEQAEKDILSKITKEHLDALKWIEHSGITTQPHLHHKYCKDLCAILENLLKDG